MQVHALVATSLRAPELFLHEVEADALAKSIAEVQALYGSKVDPRTEAWVKLAVVLSATYGKRGFDIYVRLQHEKTERAKPPASAVPHTQTDYVPEGAGFKVEDNIPPPE